MRYNQHYHTEMNIWNRTGSPTRSSAVVVIGHASRIAAAALLGQVTSFFASETGREKLYEPART